MNETSAKVLDPQRRRLLLETAAHEFASAGYERASLNRIIHACGMGKSSFYYYISSKQELFDLVVSEVGASLLQQMELPPAAELAKAGFWEEVHRLLQRVVILSEREPRFTDLGRMFYLPGTPSAGNDALARAQRAIGQWLDTALAAGREAGAVRHDLPESLQASLTMAVLRTLDEWTLHHQQEFDHGQTRELLDAQLDLLQRLLAPSTSAEREQADLGLTRCDS